jgi:hypothetical protein
MIGHDVNENGILLSGTFSIHQCIELCESHPDCKSVVTEYYSGDCRLKYKTYPTKKPSHSRTIYCAKDTCPADYVLRLGRGDKVIGTPAVVATAELCGAACYNEADCMSFEYDDQSTNYPNIRGTRRLCRLLTDLAPSYQKPIDEWPEEKRDFVFCQKAGNAWPDIDGLIAGFKIPIKFEYPKGLELFVRGSYNKLNQTVWNRFRKIKMNPDFDSDGPMIQLESSFMDVYPDGMWAIEKTGQICTEFGTSEHFSNTYKGYVRANLTTKDIDVKWDKILCKGGCAGTDCMHYHHNMNFPIKTRELKSVLKNDTNAIHYF